VRQPQHDYLMPPDCRTIWGRRRPRVLVLPNLFQLFHPIGGIRARSSNFCAPDCIRSLSPNACAPASNGIKKAMQKSIAVEIEN
jgi:hypothetical protein